jgi:hypothetical protein
MDFFEGRSAKPFFGQKTKKSFFPCTTSLTEKIKICQNFYFKFLFWLDNVCLSDWMVSISLSVGFSFFTSLHFYMEGGLHRL